MSPAVQPAIISRNLDNPLTRNHQIAAAGAAMRTFAIRGIFSFVSHVFGTRGLQRAATYVRRQALVTAFLSQFACAIPASVIPSHSRRCHVPFVTCSFVTRQPFLAQPTSYPSGTNQLLSCRRLRQKRPARPRGQNKLDHTSCGQSLVPGSFDVRIALRL